MNKSIETSLNEWKFRISNEAPHKYDGAGVYCIKVDNIMVYIGKSTDMLHRIASHIVNWTNPNSKEYKRPVYASLRNFANSGAAITFDVLCRGTNLDELEMEQQLKYSTGGCNLGLCRSFNNGRGGSIPNPYSYFNYYWQLTYSQFHDIEFYPYKGQYNGTYC